MQDILQERLGSRGESLQVLPIVEPVQISEVTSDSFRVTIQ
jgi:hypothetical protein